VVGGGARASGAQGIGEKPGIEEDVEFTGRLDYRQTEELARLVAAAWPNAHISVAEGRGHSMLEAAAAEAPRFAYDVPGISDATEEGRNEIKVMDGASRLKSSLTLFPEDKASMSALTGLRGKCHQHSTRCRASSEQCLFKVRHVRALVGKPLISVIITAHTRKEFLLQAVSSALRQTLPREFYEVIVVKNFEDDGIDGELKRMGVTNLHSTNIGFGAKVSEALEVARGDIISPLEDDDMFSVRKLEAVKSVFERKDVIFHRNRRVFVNGMGKLIGEERPQPAFEARGKGLDRHGTMTCIKGDGVVIRCM